MLGIPGRRYLSECGHVWQQHLYILYDLEEIIVAVKDSAVEALLRQHVTDVELREAVISDLKKRTEAYRNEYHQIQEAAEQLGNFIKEKSITPFNNEGRRRAHGATAVLPQALWWQVSEC